MSERIKPPWQPPDIEAFDPDPDDDFWSPSPLQEEVPNEPCEPIAEL